MPFILFTYLRGILMVNLKHIEALKLFSLNTSYKAGTVSPNKLKITYIFHY